MHILIVAFKSLSVWITVSIIVYLHVLKMPIFLTVILACISYILAPLNKLSITSYPVKSVIINIIVLLLPLSFCNITCPMHMQPTAQKSMRTHLLVHVSKMYFLEG